MKRRTSSDILIPVRFASFLSLAIWESERNMEMRFMVRIYVGHIFLSRTKRTRAENKFAELERILLARIRSKVSVDLQRICNASFNRANVRPACCALARGKQKGQDPTGIPVSTWPRVTKPNFGFFIATCPRRKLSCHQASL
jgi:hypothetical protein